MFNNNILYNKKPVSKPKRDKLKNNKYTHKIRVDNVSNYKQKLVDNLSNIKSIDDTKNAINKINEYIMSDCNPISVIYKSLNVNAFLYLINNGQYEMCIYNIKQLMIILSKLDVVQSKNIFKQMYFKLYGFKIPITKIRSINKCTNDSFTELVIREVLTERILKILFCNEINNTTKLLVCKYFMPYLNFLCFGINRCHSIMSNLDGICLDMVHDTHLRTFSWNGSNFYKLDKDNDILNYYRVILDGLTEERLNSFPYDIFNIRKYIETRNKIINYIDCDIIYCSRYNYNIIKTILLSIYYHKKIGFKNLIKQFLCYYFN